MWESLFRVAFYGGVGLALAAAVVWYIGSLYSMLAGKGEVVIAPFEIVRANGAVDKGDGIALAHMLQVQLHEVEQGIEAAQMQLMGKPPEGRAARIEESVPQAPGAFGIPPPSLPPVLIQGVGMQTRLLDPAEVKVSVAGVEVGQVVPWLQRQLVIQRTVVFTIYEKKQSVHVTGALKPMGLDDSLALDMKTDGTEDVVPLDRVVEQMAYEITRRRLAANHDNRVDALDGQEFQSLVEVLRETARLNRQVERGRTLPAAFQELLQTATKLAESVDGWYQLDNLTASIAESAKDWDSALKFYQRTEKGLPTGSKFNDLRKSVADKIVEVQTKVTNEQTPSTRRALSVDAEQARRKMEEYVKEAVDFYNNLLGQRLKPPVVKIQTDVSLKYNPYYDGDKKIVADSDVQFLPDMTFRNAAWPHLLAMSGIQVGQQDEANDILYSAVDVLTMLMHQHYLKQDAASSDWELGKGYMEWVNGKKLTKPFEGTPWVSFAKPAVANIRNRSTKEYERQYVNSGIWDKAFYLVATKRSTDRAAEIWISVLRQLKKLGRVDYLRFGRLLFEAAGPDKDAVRDALHEIGLDIEKPIAAAKK
jgi:Zn-dependent metalloprotease